MCIRRVLFYAGLLQNSLAEQKQTAEHLKQQIGELTAANKQLQQEIAERQQEITERQQTENELEQYSNQLEQQIEKQTTELAAANGNFRLQTAECQRLEQCFIQLRTKLDNINSIIKDQLELREGGPKVLKSSTSAPAPLGCAYN